MRILQDLRWTRHPLPTPPRSHLPRESIGKNDQLLVKVDETEENPISEIPVVQSRQIPGIDKVFGRITIGKDDNIRNRRNVTVQADTDVYRSEAATVASSACPAEGACLDPVFNLLNCILDDATFTDSLENYLTNIEAEAEKLELKEISDTGLDLPTDWESFGLQSEDWELPSPSLIQYYVANYNSSWILDYLVADEVMGK